MSGFARRPAGSVDATEVAAQIGAASERVADLRHDLGQLCDQAVPLRGSGLIELDLRRAMTALGAAALSLERGRRNVELLG